jgi:D-hydroxyproline dehydrogenase subunit alpha
VAEVVRTEVVVVGGGPAGLAAATVAAESGRNVLVLDEAPALGGQIWRHRPDDCGHALPARARAWIERFRRSGARFLPGVAVIDAPDRSRLVTDQDGHALRVEAEAIVLATGARECFLPFPGWTLPGVLGVGGAQALVKSGASFAGRRIVVSGSGPLLLPVAASLKHAGAEVMAVAEQAPRKAVLAFAASLGAQPGKLAEAIRYRLAFARVPYMFGTWVREARGEGRVAEVLLTDGHREWPVPCDALACAYGLLPNLELARLLGCAIEDGAVAVDGDQQTSVPSVFAAGEASGMGGVDLALIRGQIAGLSVSDRKRDADALRRARRRANAFAESLRRAFVLREELKGLPRAETLVCRCEDVAFGRLRAEWTPRQAKLYTRAGMGACQGRICGPALSHLLGWPCDAVRPPLSPVSLAALKEADS